jgi:hypothetical protein
MISHWPAIRKSPFELLNRLLQQGIAIWHKFLSVHPLHSGMQSGH